MDCTLGRIRAPDRAPALARIRCLGLGLAPARAQERVSVPALERASFRSQDWVMVPANWWSPGIFDALHYRRLGRHRAGCLAIYQLSACWVAIEHMMQEDDGLMRPEHAED